MIPPLYQTELRRDMPKKFRNSHAKPGKWFLPRQRKFIMVCCDCNLAHTVDFGISAGRVVMRAWRENKITKKLRAKNGSGRRIRTPTTPKRRHGVKVRLPTC